MTLQQLRDFVASVEHGSLRRAAHAEGKSEADVRRVLCEAKAARSEATPIHSTITPDAGTEAPERPEASPVVAAVKKLIHKE